MKRNVLIGTIIYRSKFPHKALRDIIEIIGKKKIFVFEIKNQNQFLLTYDIDKDKVGTIVSEIKAKYKNTIRIHRKKKTNSFFTINSLNKLEENENIIDWETLNNRLILTSKDGAISKMDIALRKVIK